MALRPIRVLMAAVVVAAVSTGGEVPVAASEVLVRAQVASHASEVVEETETLRRVAVPVHPGDTIPIEIEIVVASRFDGCVLDPDTCAGGEEPVAGECIDELDNDGDGLVDFEDPDCIGVQGYVLVVGTGASFHLRGNDLPDETRGTTFTGTVSDDYTRPPGIARPPLLRYVDTIDPENNGGQEGAVGVCTLGLLTYVILRPDEDSSVLKLRGDMDISGLEPGDTTPLCLIDIRSPGEAGLVGMGAPVVTEMVVLGKAVAHATQDLELFLRVVRPPVFRRGDANGDGAVDISDVLYILNYLFAGGNAPACLDSADTDDNNALEITDGIAMFDFLFSGHSPPPPPGPFDCGPDPTADDIPCAAYPSC